MQKITNQKVFVVEWTQNEEEKCVGRICLPNGQAIAIFDNATDLALWIESELPNSPMIGMVKPDSKSVQ